MGKKYTMNTSRLCVVLCLGLLCGGPQASAQATSKAAQGPSLWQTFLFIKNLLAKNGKVAWKEEFRTDYSRNYEELSEEITSADQGSESSEEGNCTLHYHLLWTSMGDTAQTHQEVLYGDDFAFHYKDVKAIRIDGDGWRAGTGVFTVANSTSQPIYRVELDGPAAREGSGNQHFTLTDPVKAGQLARAIAHAAELCGASPYIQSGNNFSSQDSAAIRSPPSSAANHTDPPLGESMSKMQAILENLGKQGHIDEAPHNHNPGWYPRRPDDVEYQETWIGSVAMHPETCSMEYEVHSSTDHGAETEDAVRFSLRDIENVTVDAVDQEVVDARHLELIQQKLKIDAPPAYSPVAVSIILPKIDPEKGIPLWDYYETIRFPDKSSAAAFRSLLLEAAESCRGQKELF